MKMKFATVSRGTNEIIDLFDGEADAYKALMSYGTDGPWNYGVRMLIMDSNDNIVIRGGKDLN